MLLGFIVVVAIIDLLLTGAIAKWAIFAPVFVPLLMKLGVEPEAVLAAYRVGDSPMNAITPLNAYFALVVGFAQKYDKSAGVGTIVSLMLPYVVLDFRAVDRLSSRSGRLSVCHGDCNGRPPNAKRSTANDRMDNMSNSSIPLDVAAAEEHLMRFLSVEGVTGQEKPTSRLAVSDALKKVGVPDFGDPFRRCQQAHSAADGNGQPDRGPSRNAAAGRGCFSPRISTPCRSAPAPSRDARATASSRTAQPRSAAMRAPASRVLVVVAETLIKYKLPHPPITLLFTVREESGLHGARELNPADLGGAAMCINVDGQMASDLIIGAVGQENWEVEITGRASHAGVAPEKASRPRWSARWPWPRRAGPAGSARSSSPMAAAPAMSASSAARTDKPAGDATNVVTDYAFIKGEARSPESAFATKIANGYEEAFAKAQGRGEG